VGHVDGVRYIDGRKEAYGFEYVAARVTETVTATSRKGLEEHARHLGRNLPRIDVLLRVELPCGCVASYLDRPADRFIRTDVGILPRDDEGGHDCKHGCVFVQYLPGVPLP
jgi:hypothetical protein